ncbi:macrophage mannose receptor 1-like isoform X1 [Xyrauchen texanus]|uniref:macrophage mannose receptor 1-like isoform X1 n=1 Tax=Xyrauchen texanus TaxID=154827 RepID=UPI002241CEA3|nr:macrophage mannose receptor 1-like isoform X1 [Xyrauchen texanus]
MNLILFIFGSCISSGLSKQFVFVNELKTYDDAQSFCRKHHNDLATIEDMTDLNDLQNTVRGITETSAWIGLKKEGPPLWYWSLNNREFYREGEAEYRNWLTGEPNNWGGNQNCVAIDDGGKFQDRSCSNQFQFICYDGNVNVAQRYVFINQKMTRNDAQMYCRTTHTDLVSIRNLEENQQVQAVVPAGAVVYIGLYKESYRWSDNSSSLFRRWSLNEPDNSGPCVEHIFQLNAWRDQICSTARPFICTSVLKMQILRVKVKSSLNVNDPAMMTTVLQKIQQNLVNLGMSKDAKLVWRVQSDGAVFHTVQNKNESALSVC